MATELLLPQNKPFRYGMWFLIASCLASYCALFMFHGVYAIFIFYPTMLAAIFSTVAIIIGFVREANEWKTGHINPLRWQARICGFVVMGLLLFLNRRSKEWKLTDHPNSNMDSKYYPGYRTVSRGWPFPYSSTIYGLGDAGTRPYSEQTPGRELFLILDILSGLALILLTLYALQQWMIT